MPVIDYGVTLRRLVGVLTVKHCESNAGNYREYSTVCPCCGIMDLHRHIPDAPENHQGGCPLIEARRVLGIYGATDQSTGDT